MLLVGALFIIVGLVILFEIGRPKLGGGQRRGWQQVTGRVTRVSVEPRITVVDTAAGAPAHLRVEYEYTLRARTHRGAQRLAENHVVRVGDAARRVDVLREGDAVPVWHDTDAPEHSTLTPEDVPRATAPPRIAWAWLVMGLTLVSYRLLAG